MAGVTGNRAWALAIAERIEAGKFVDRIAQEWAAEVLDRPLLKGGKHARRPDVKDLQANDRHGDEGVSI